MSSEPPTVQSAIDQASLVLQYLESNREVGWDLSFLESHCRAIVEFARQAERDRAAGAPQPARDRPARRRRAS